MLPISHQPADMVLKPRLLAQGSHGTPPSRGKPPTIQQKTSLLSVPRRQHPIPKTLLLHQQHPAPLP